jgi:hypothetical protein
MLVAGWWSTYDSEIYACVKWDDDIPNIWKNHQPVYFLLPWCGQIVTLLLRVLLFLNRSISMYLMAELHRNPPAGTVAK